MCVCVCGWCRTETTDDAVDGCGTQPTHDGPAFGESVRDGVDADPDADHATCDADVLHAASRHLVHATAKAWRCVTSVWPCLLRLGRR